MGSFGSLTNTPRSHWRFPHNISSPSCERSAFTRSPLLSPSSTWTDVLELGDSPRSLLYLPKLVHPPGYIYSLSAHSSVVAQLNVPRCRAGLCTFPFPTFVSSFFIFSAEHFTKAACLFLAIASRHRSTVNASHSPLMSSSRASDLSPCPCATSPRSKTPAQAPLHSLPG